MAYGLPASAWLENALPSPLTNVNGPPKFAFTAPPPAWGSDGVWVRGMRINAAVPAMASTTSTHRSSRTCFRVDLGGAFSVNSDHHAQIGAPLRRVEGAYRPAVCQRNLPRETKANAAAPFMR